MAAGTKQPTKSAKTVRPPAAPPSDDKRAIREAEQAASQEPPVRARPARRVELPKPKEEPDLVLVRAIERGQYGLDVDIIIRNEGEVFPMATSAMRKWPLAKGECPVDGAVIIETERGQFELPRWVELVEDDEQVDASELVSHGHRKKWHQQLHEDGTRNLDVL